MTNEEIAALLTSGSYKVVEQEAILHIQHQRYNAQMWVYLGEALLRQGKGHSAAQVFKRAQLLDPESSWVEAVNKELLKAPSGSFDAGVEALLSKNKVTVAAAILVRNEIRCIEQCLLSLIDEVDEIIVIDCESTDGTREFIQSFPQVKLISFSWCDDFSAARNAGLPYIESDWVIWVDADEVLISEDKQQIREAAAVYDPIEEPVVLLGGVQELIGKHKSIHYSKGRMFALKHDFKFSGRVHEQIGYANDAAFNIASSKEVVCMPVLIRFNHDGYTPDIMLSKNKLARNLRLLEMMLSEEPDNPAWWLFYGRETFGSGDVAKALGILKEANAHAKQQVKFTRRLEILVLLIVAHYSLNEWIEAEIYCNEALQLRPDFPDALFYMGQIEMNKARELYRSAEIRLRKLKESARTYRGVVSPDSSIVGWKADAALAHVARTFGKLASARQIYQQVSTNYPHLHEIQTQLNLIEEQRQLLNGNH